MGWLISASSTTRRDFIRRITENTGENRQCLKRVTRGNILWTVWEVTPPGRDPIRYIGYDILQRFEGKRWGFKDGDESCGPSHLTCPLSFFKDVPEPPNQWAREWRSEVIALAASRRFKLGDWLELMPRYVPRFVKVTGLRPTRASGYCIHRKNIRRVAYEINELVAKLDMTFGSKYGRNGWAGDLDPDPETVDRMIDFAKANPVAVNPVFFAEQRICPVLVKIWMDEKEAA